jgi:hypothetical protein
MAVETRDDHGYWDGRGLALVWFAVLAGPAALVLNQLAGYALVKWACASGHVGVLTSIAAASLALAAAGGWIGWVCRRRTHGAGEHGGGIEDRTRFMAIVGIGLSVLMGLLIVLQAYPQFVLSPCE